jgi:ABC-type polysaccharide/polyol phosphate export permease
MTQLNTDTFLIPGIIWPLDGVHESLKFIGSMLPLARPVAAFRSVLVKNSSIYDQQIYLAILTVIAWIVGLLALCFWLLREKKVKSRKL